LLTVLYLAWRILFTLNAEQPIASGIFLFVDILMCFSAILFVVSLWRKPKEPAPCNSVKQFSIDVFVPTYNEDCNLLETTLQHCLDMDYPHKTWLLDDGNRLEMKQLAERLGTGYIIRENNAGAKAGNLNNALQHTRGELVAVLDADFRPEREFLTRLAAFFNDEKVAVAQSPQHYYNTDSFQHRRISKKEIYSDQDTFMHLVLPARNSWNAAYWIGTNALMRREAIESIGGFPTDSVTEDVLTGMYLHGRGWKTVYLDEPLAYGLAPANIAEYSVQRLRWAKGAFQILRSHNPLFQKGLSFMQRLFYFSSVSHFFEGAAKTVYYLFPAFFFLFGTVPVYPYAPILIGMLLYFGITLLLLALITGERTNLVMDEIYSVIKSFIYLTALPAFVFNRNIRFRVTPKSRGKSLSFRGVAGPAIIFGFNFAALTAVLLRLFAGRPPDMFGWIVSGWCLYTGSMAFTACLYCFKPLIKKNKIK
jgi:cellulose synthase (UDP-forming)